ncbi:MAG: HTTM domain-containing protein [Bacteroidetes bacterium]|nr:HTTM domain-containing protein [Bacteroidota bacterium]
MTAISRIQKTFFDWHREVPAASLAVYRIFFGGLMLFSTVRFWLNGWVRDFYIEPEFHFSYLGFDWIPYPNAGVLYFMFAILVLACLGIIFGFFYRTAALTFLVLFTYVELLDKTTYLNHYYFVSLVALLMVFVPANRYFSLDVYFGFAPAQKTVPNWSIALLKFQMGIVYVFAGIAKLESDWLLDAQPLKFWLHTAHHWPLFGDLLKQDWIAYFFSWFGCIYDLFIVFFLLNARTRNVAYFFVIVFHFTTWMLFPIGVFPWVMMVGTTIFLSVQFHERILKLLGTLFKRSRQPVPATYFVRPNFRKQVNWMFGIFIAFQVLVPFRYLLYPGNLFWTEQGFRFSWRVMLMEKSGYAEFYLVDPQTKTEWNVPTKKHLTRLQEKMMCTQPDMILQYAHYLQTVYSDTTLYLGDKTFTFNDPEVHAEIYVTLNGRPSQLYVAKKHNLAAIPNDLSNRYWLEDFKE